MNEGTIAVDSWGTYAASMTVGDAAISAPTIGGVVPSGASKSFSTTTPSFCQVDSGTGAVTAIDDGTCTITATLSKTGYTDKTNNYDITINEGTIAVSNWGTYSSVTVGASAGAAPNLLGFNPSDATKNYTTSTGTLCNVDSGTGAVTGIDDGTCTVTLTLSKTGYADKTNEYSITINEGVIALTDWGTYGTVTVGSGAVSAPAITDLNPSWCHKKLLYNKYNL